jgi:hypothetical protein
MRAVRSLVLGVILLAALSTPAGAADVDLELVLAVDVSRSIDDDEFKLQRQGYAQAFLHPSVIAAILSNPKQRIAVTFVEWAGVEFQKVVIPWTVIGDAESGQLFAQEIEARPRAFFGWTSVSGAIDFGVAQFRASPHSSTRRVIDVSGDGINNSGRPANEARDDALRLGITINALAIMNENANPGFFFQRQQPPLDEFFRTQVIGGPGAFMIAIEDFSSFAYAIVNKLVKEIAHHDAPADVQTAALPH